MNYTKLGIEKTEERLEGSSQSNGKRVGVTLLRLLFVILILTVVITVCGTIGVVRGIIANAPDIDDINIQPSGFATFIYDAEGNQLQKLTSSDSNRTAVALDNVPITLQHAVVAIEDERFYTHNGIDPRGIARAAFRGITSGFRFSEGASTITQQLLKNNVFTNWTKEGPIERIERKFQEQYLAVKLEEKLQNKDLILENYLNTINLGAGTYGVEAASKKYFNKDVWDLTLSEASVLAGITQNPAKYNPIRHPEENAKRRETVLRKMVEQGYITQADMDLALADNVYDRIQAAQAVEQTVNKVYTYFIDELTQQVISDLQKQKGYTENQAYQALYSGGLRIYTTQDPAIQAVVDEEYQNPENFPNGTQYSMDWALSVQKANGETVNYSREMLEKFYHENLPPETAADFDLSFDSAEEGQAYIDDYKNHVIGEGDTVIAERTSFAPQPQSSMVVMDQRTGYVKAIQGGRGEKTASLTLNRATDTLRQPGSTFKILSTYAPLLDSGEKTLASLYKDAKYAYADGTEVHNASNSYSGWMSVRDAIVHSVNIVAVKAITDLTPQQGYNELLKFGFTSLDPANDVYQPLALGGITNGVSNLELTAAYAAIANQGSYTKPIFYSKILDQSGNVVIDNTPETTRVISEDTAWLLTSAMEDVVNHGTGTALRLSNGMPVAGKTGTTSKYNDVWFVGYTPYYTIGVWAGYDDNTKLPDEGIYRKYHQTLWRKVMERLTDGKAVTDFQRPGTVKQVQICAHTGLKPSRYCNDVATEYVSADAYPRKSCTECRYTNWDDADAEIYGAFEADGTTFTRKSVSHTARQNTNTEGGYYEDEEEETGNDYDPYGNDTYYNDAGNMDYDYEDQIPDDTGEDGYEEFETYDQYE